MYRVSAMSALRKVELLRVTACIIAMSLAFIPSRSTADPPSTEHAVVARSTGDALLLWDASADVSAIVSTKLPDNEANGELKRAAIRVLAVSTKAVSKDAKSITIRILYNKSGAVSPVYGAATFAGVEHYAEITMTGSDFFADRGRWQSLKNGDAFPPWVTFRITGTLPPR